MEIGGKLYKQYAEWQPGRDENRVRGALRAYHDSSRKVRARGSGGVKRDHRVAGFACWPAHRRDQSGMGTWSCESGRNLATRLGLFGSVRRVSERPLS